MNTEYNVSGNLLEKGSNKTNGATDIVITKLGSIKISELNLTIEVKKDDVYLNGEAMKENTNAAIDQSMNVVMGAFIREFD